MHACVFHGSEGEDGKSSVVPFIYSTYYNYYYVVVVVVTSSYRGREETGKWRLIWRDLGHGASKQAGDSYDR